MSFKKPDYLGRVLDSHRMNHIDSLIDKFKIKRTEIKEKLEHEYGDKIYSPFNSGSWKKYTAINSKFDLDIVIPFKRNSFSTIVDMFDNLYEFLREEYKGLAHVRPQKVSIGIEFYADEDGDKIQIDVVPGRELSQDDFLVTNKLNLNINTYDGNYIQTNIEEQIKNIKGKSDAREIIRLLKIWKQQQNKDIKSFFMELIVIKAFDNKIITGNLWEKLKIVLEYISEEVTKDRFTLIDPGNSNNDVGTSLSSFQKQSLKNSIEYILDDVERKDENLKNHFNQNEKFKVEEKANESNSSGYKVGDTSKAIIPPSNQFG
ncbi:SMODS domain-containing nucleotidyltransferase [Olleya namhaensis]|uniref:SMODS domain-containing nucleotidyltransferase n=1 Tax=Olleya namhaensis TaxID=1144750 RepID=UPI00248F76B2|nr:nucleotidyltransferase [Olleya namhaensis]